MCIQLCAGVHAGVLNALWNCREDRPSGRLDYPSCATSDPHCKGPLYEPISPHQKVWSLEALLVGLSEARILASEPGSASGSNRGCSPFTKRDRLDHRRLRPG
jgi:hypothetical protein